jgi:hypothetical protein
MKLNEILKSVKKELIKKNVSLFSEVVINQVLDDDGRTLLAKKYSRRMRDMKYISMYNHMASIISGMVVRYSALTKITETPNLFVGSPEELQYMLITITKQLSDMSEKLAKYAKEMNYIEHSSYRNTPEFGSVVLFTEPNPDYYLSKNALDGKFKFKKLSCNLLEDRRAMTEFYNSGHVFYNGSIELPMDKGFEDISFNIMKIGMDNIVTGRDMFIDPFHLRQDFKSDKYLEHVIHGYISQSRIIITIGFVYEHMFYLKSVDIRSFFNKATDIYTGEFIQKFINLCVETINDKRKANHRTDLLDENNYKL